MKKTIALFLAVALLGVGLIASCSDDPEPAKEPPAPVVKFKVTFDSDGRPFADGTTAAKVVEWVRVDSDKKASIEVSKIKAAMTGNSKKLDINLGEHTATELEYLQLEP